MELRALWVLFLREWPLLSLSTVFFFVLGFGVVAGRPPVYRTVLDLYVKRQTQPPSDKFYSFDGYYSQQAAERYTQTVVGFLRSREVWREAAATLGQPTDTTSLRKLERVIKVKEAAPQLVSLSVSGPEKDLVANLSLALARVAMLRLQALNQTGDTALSLELVTTTPLVEKERLSPGWGGSAAVVLGWLLLILFFSLREYLHDSPRP
jgi:uncharacterized protein involved in exopolysaccharide biosynthesis